jgi:glutathione S-transferase
VPDVIVHTIPGNPFARAVLATLEEKRVPWRIAPLRPGEHRQQPHLSRNPFGRMPAIEHGDFALYETQAIVRYIDRVWPSPALTPREARAAAQMDQAMNVNDWYLFPGCGNVIGFQRVVGPKVMGLTPDEAAIAAAMPHARRVFDELSRLLGDKPYFGGDRVSLAEMMLVPQPVLMPPQRPALCVPCAGGMPGSAAPLAATARSRKRTGATSPRTEYYAPH